jgi:hypothetical protein
LSDRYCYLPLSWKSWNWFECAVGGVQQYHSFILPTYTVLQYAREMNYSYSCLM